MQSKAFGPTVIFLRRRGDYPNGLVLDLGTDCTSEAPPEEVPTMIRPA